MESEEKSFSGGRQTAEKYLNEVPYYKTKHI